MIAIDANGELRVWHFGELIAISAGLSGALAARGVRRGDVVMILIGNRIEWVLAMLACWRMGAVALPCNAQLRRHDLELRVGAAQPALAIGDELLLGLLPEGLATMTLAELGDVMDEDRPQEAPVEPAGLDPSDGALIVFTSGTTGEPRPALHAQRYLAGQRIQAEREGEVDGSDEDKVDAFDREDRLQILEGFHALDLDADDDLLVRSLPILAHALAECQPGVEAAEAALAIRREPGPGDDLPGLLG